MPSTREDRTVGGFLGLALGDALGAPFEGGVVERALWACIGRTRKGERRFTDDTQMSIDLADSLVANGGLDQDDLARRFAGSYRWSRGYGPGAARTLKLVRRGTHWSEAARAAFADGSFGNGAAMRAPVLGWWHGDVTPELVTDVERSAEVTHAHPLGVEGAVIVASAVAAATRHGELDAALSAAADACRTEEFRRRIALVQEWWANGHEPPVAEVRSKLGNGIAAVDSCATALHVAAVSAATEFTELLATARAIGGDVDTIGAMAGSVWGSLRGTSAFPDGLSERLEGATRIRESAQAIAAR